MAPTGQRGDPVDLGDTSDEDKKPAQAALGQLQATPFPTAPWATSAAFGRPQAWGRAQPEPFDIWWNSTKQQAS
jgi:hypothetical protein